MQETETIWFNGNLVPWKEAQVHVLTHSLHYGGGAFEGIRFYHTDKGPAVFRLKEHIERLFYSCQTLHMKMNFTQEQVIDGVKEIVQINGLKEGYIRPLAFYGYTKMGVNPIGNPVELIIACWPWGAYLPHESVDIKTSKYIRLHPDSTVIDAKLTGHYLNGILASLEIQGTKYHEVLFLDTHGHICEGAGENFFIVKDNVIYTPKLGTILAGITRATIIELCHHLKLKIIEKDLSLTEAYQADEAFFTGTAAEVTPIHSINDHIIGNGKIGPISTRIKQQYMDIVHGKNPEFLHYLTFIH